jgi:hypothetical protein
MVMFTLVGTVVFVAAIAVVIVRARRKSRDGQPAHSPPPPPVYRPPQLSSLVDRFGGTANENTFRFGRDGYHVAVRFIRTTRDDIELVQTQLIVSGNLAPIDIGPESVRASSDIQTGDENFDGLAQISGDPAMAVAVLGPETRRKLGPALMQGWTVDKNSDAAHLRREWNGQYLDGMIGHVEAGLALARLLARPPDLHAALVARLRAEPTLDGRLAIATHLPIAMREDATHLPALIALTEPDVRLIVAARLDHPDLWATLTEGDLLVLARHASTIVVKAAISALARTGSALCIPDLKRLASRGGDLGRLAKDVVLMIQSRLSGSRGDLALASESDGNLAIVDPKAAR